MKKRYFGLFFVLLCANLYAEDEHSLDPVCREEFNILEYWHDGMTWDEFLAIRNNLQREGLIKYVDKIGQQELAKEAGLKAPETYIITREKEPFVDLLSSLSSYVAKVTHLSYSEGLLIVKDGINLITGEPITPEQVQEEIFNTFERKPRPVESWALHHIEPGFMVQEYVPNRVEVKMLTVWGKAVIGEWRGGERKSKTTAILGRYDREGNEVDNNRKAPIWWADAVEKAELIAKGTDALRADFLIKEDGEVLLNELAIWPELNWKSMDTTLAEMLNEGYRNLYESTKKEPLEQD